GPHPDATMGMGRGLGCPAAEVPMVATQPRAGGTARTRPALIDCDIHNELDSETELYPYLPERWREYLRTYGLREPSGAYYPRFMGHRPDATPPSGRRAGSDVGFMRENYLDPSDVAVGILLPLFPVGRSLHGELAAALATGVNDWQLAEWLDKEPRLRASIVVPYEFAE